MDSTGRMGESLLAMLRRQALTFKLGWILVLVLVLLIPLSMIRGVLSDRLNYRNQAVQSIVGSWGGNQNVTGPVLVIPYRYRFKTWKEREHVGRVEVEETAVGKIIVLPDELNVEGELTPEMLHRGIYEAVVYTGDLEISGQFPPPDLDELGISEGDVLWDQAAVTLGIDDLRGTGELLTIEVDGQTHTFTPGSRLDGTPGVTARLPELEGPGGGMAFAMGLTLKGSGGLRFAPVGRLNTVRLSSTWGAPSFVGAFLPEPPREVGPEGFDALWKVSWYGRTYPQQAATRGDHAALTAAALAGSTFGVDLLSPVDSYRMVERAIKYGVLFIGMIFTSFFLFERLAALRIHTIQYTLVGGAICLFYLAVLSLSEFAPFGWAYLAGAVASGALIVCYSLAVLRGGRRTALIAGALAALYGYLYVALRLQSYSLLLGTLGLFAALAIVMYATRDLEGTSSAHDVASEAA